jgi:hypothetical protein
MQPIIDRFNSLIRPALRNFAAADAAFVAAQTVGTGVDEARQAVMLPPARPPSNCITSPISSSPTRHLR